MWLFLSHMERARVQYFLLAGLESEYTPGHDYHTQPESELVLLLSSSPFHQQRSIMRRATILFALNTVSLTK